MDWIRQKTFQNWVIGVLVVLNLISLALVWLQLGRRNPPQPAEPRGISAVSVSLMRNELGLSSEQVAEYEKLRSDQMGTMRSINDELDSLKLTLVDEMFDATHNETSLDSAIKKIGMLQSELEMLRFRHFSALVQICDQKQRVSLQPVLREVFGKRGREGNPTSGRTHDQILRPQDETTDRRRPSDENRLENAAPGRNLEGRPAPPSIEEKLDRYAHRLSLSAAQRTAIEQIMRSTRDAEELVKSSKPTVDDFEREKGRLRRQEDQKIMDLLSAEQRAEFEKMLRNRMAPPRQ
jgi:hypothetical protein